MSLSLDTQAIVLLCSHLGLTPQSEAEPLTLRGWNSLEYAIKDSGLEGPGELLDMSASNLEARLGSTEEEAARLARLLKRSGELAVELERLESMGIRPLTRGSSDYPGKLRERLKDSAPVVFFYAGNPDLLNCGGIAVVGSRRADQSAHDCAVYIGEACAAAGQMLVSGAAKGVDMAAMTAALEAGGTSVGMLADSLERSIRGPEAREALSRGDLCLATPYAPNAPFSVGAAMGRNKLIYALSDYAVVVASDAKTGGTWAGATEALKKRWVPVFVYKHDQMPPGNELLLEMGASAFQYPFAEDQTITEWLSKHSRSQKPQSQQLEMF